jgi:hypothetical protein
MLKIDNVDVYGWEAAIRGMRNPKNSWVKSDSKQIGQVLKGEEIAPGVNRTYWEACVPYTDVGPNDLKLMTTLRNAGTDHRKFMRMIVVYLDITAPLYWWKEFDTYKVGTVADSCSTMHKIHAKEFTLSDFSHEHLMDYNLLKETIAALNFWRDIFVNGGKYYGSDKAVDIFEPKDKRAWRQLIQLLPSAYNQKRTVMLNYEVLANMYKSRKDHKLNEWHTFCDWVETLPYSELVTGNKID